MVKRLYDFKRFQFHGKGWGFEYVHHTSSYIKTRKERFKRTPLWLERIRRIVSFISDLSNILIPLLGM